MSVTDMMKRKTVAVIRDFRAPDIMRFGFTQLYLEKAGVIAAIEIIEDVICNEPWREPRYQIRSRMT